MQAGRLDAEARLRSEVRAVIADLRSYGTPEYRMHGRCLVELWDMRNAAIRDLMRPPDPLAV